MASSMSAETYAADSSVRSRSSTLPSMDKSAMSYQPVMRMPPLRVTGMVGAVGNTHRTPSTGIWDATSAHPCPVSPRPCRKMQTAFVAPPSGGGTTIGAG